MQAGSQAPRSRIAPWAVLASAAIGVPALLAFNLPPSSTFLNQAAALVGWGAWLVVLAASFAPGAARWSQGLAGMHAALALLLVAALASPLWTGLPWSLALSNAGLIGAAALAAQVAAAAQRDGLGVQAFRALCIGLVVTALASSAIGIVQVFAPAWPDGDWVARSYIAGRSVGNMRQPNHLSSLLLWAIVAALWLGESRVLKRSAAAVLAAVFLFVVALSGSRTGALSVVLLALWGLLDRRLSGPTRLLLLLAPFAYAAFYASGGGSRFSTGGDVSSSRFLIWSNTLELIRAHPWAGVGFGEFNLAWTLTPFAARPVAFFDHTHNLPLQFAVELGVPLTLVVLALLLWALFTALRAALRARSDPDTRQAPMRRAAFMMVFLILVHSQFEYPLWYAYFLLPAAFAFGLCVGQSVAISAPAQPPSACVPPAPAPQGIRPLFIASLVLMLGGAASLIDYSRVVVIYAPPDNAPPLAQRIADGRRSVFFSHHADYAAATTFETAPDSIRGFGDAPHYLLDARLLQAWAKALDASGDTERARHVAQRLREFKSEQSAAFFEPCAGAQAASATLPFQCEAPMRRFGYEDFR